MGLDRRDGREELRSDLPVRLSRATSARPALSVRQLAIAPGTGLARRSSFSARCAHRLRPQLGEDRPRRLELLGRTPALALAAERLAGDEKGATTVERESGRSKACAASLARAAASRRLPARAGAAPAT